MAIQTFTANEARTHFGEFIDRAQRGSVRVTRRDRVVGVLVSAEDDEVMRAFSVDRLQATLIRTGEYASAQGLTPQGRPGWSAAGLTCWT